ncbi:SCP2 sterol-binding domain-containing protein [Ruegeria sp. 2012CJ41-6]|uniref:SCP2 sterol-binding domain-containing protein n=1 Tax=Ruegeria spongiae TaxID=2942209 RepID=A0ABT0PXI6_9RHOB|nr:SCP2 sterol-binding domain-containing protein [Ruegeria spongiae]MCL6282232.1 SCP2 sterol-binding domain-containing protein [Ruegeria spongiae]
MSELLDQAVSALNEKLAGGAFSATAKFDVADLGAIMLDGSGARVGDDAADVTLRADVDTFQQIVAGDLDATGAFMSGRLTVDGDMSLAMQLASVLA